MQYTVRCAVRSGYKRFPCIQNTTLRVKVVCVIQTSIQRECGVTSGGRGTGWRSSDAAKGSASGSISEKRPIFSSTVICHAPAISRINYTQTHQRELSVLHHTAASVNHTSEESPGLQCQRVRRAATPSRRWPSPFPAPQTSSEETSTDDGVTEDPALTSQTERESLSFRDLLYVYLVWMCVTFSADEERCHLKHVLCESVRVFPLQSFTHLTHHQLTEIWLAVCRLSELQHPCHLHTNTISVPEFPLCKTWLKHSIKCLYFSSVAVPQVQRRHEVGVIFLHTGGPFGQLGHLKNTNTSASLKTPVCEFITDEREQINTMTWATHYTPEEKLPGMKGEGHRAGHAQQTMISQSDAHT